MYYDLDFMFSMNWAFIAYGISLAAFLLSALHYKSSVLQDGKQKEAVNLAISSVISLTSGYVFAYGLYLLYESSIDISRALRASSGEAISLLFIPLGVVAFSAPLFFASLSVCSVSVRNLRK